MKKNRLFKVKGIKESVIILALILVVTGTAAQQASDGSRLKKGNVGGYMIAQTEKVDDSYNAGYSMYVAAYPLLKEYPGRSFQSGLFGTWMHPMYDKPFPVPKL